MIVQYKKSLFFLVFSFVYGFAPYNSKHEDLLLYASEFSSKSVDNKEKQRRKLVFLFNKKADICQHLAGEVPYLFDPNGGVSNISLREKKKMVRDLEQNCDQAIKILSKIRKKYPYNSSFEELVCSYESLDSCIL